MQTGHTDMIRHRNRDFKWEISSVGYGLTIRDTYQSYISSVDASVGDTLQSADDKFSVTHGNVSRSRALTFS
ncbi:hypothetical protein BGZ91_000962 [Linnemannia elongata]|nr:hypothetical protein BGZ91_000962 [Linnemannia elongata]